MWLTYTDNPFQNLWICLCLLLILKICLSVEINFWKTTFKNLRSFRGKYLWRSSILVTSLSLRVTVFLIMILKFMVLRNFIKILSILTGKCFSLLLTVFLLTFHSMYCTVLWLISVILLLHYSCKDKKSSENQKIKLYKIKLNYTVCKVFKNYRMQKMFRIRSSIST